MRPDIRWTRYNSLCVFFARLHSLPFRHHSLPFWRLRSNALPSHAAADWLGRCALPSGRVCTRFWSSVAAPHASVHRRSAAAALDAAIPCNRERKRQAVLGTTCTVRCGAGEVLKVLDRDSARLIALKRIPLSQHSRETVSAMAEEVRRGQAGLHHPWRVRFGPDAVVGCAGAPVGDDARAALARERPEVLRPQVISRRPIPLRSNPA